MDVISALVPPLVMAGVFIAIALTALRATDGRRRRRGDEDHPEE